MKDASLSFSSPNHIPLLFGVRDRHLRQVRETVGVKVILRGDEVRLHGSDAQVQRALIVFAEMQALIERHGELSDSDVQHVLHHSDADVERDLHSLDDDVQNDDGQIDNGQIDNAQSDDAQQDDGHQDTVEHDARNGTRRNGTRGKPAPATDDTGRTNGHGRAGKAGGGNGSGTLPVEESINLFEKARRVSPRTAGQAEYVRAIRENDLVFCEGPAGCGKTYLAVAMALNALRQELVKKIVLVRPAVEAGEKLGFLPGDLIAKVNPYLRPLLDALNDMLDYDQVKRYMDKDIIEVVPLAFMRGRTLSQTFIILDEGQNTTVTQMKMFLTRLGTGSRIVVTGDTTQTDLAPEVTSGLVDAIARLSHVEGVAAVQLTGRDIVRHPLVKEIVKAYEQDIAPVRPRRKG